MDCDKLIEHLRRRGLGNGSALGHHSGLYEEAATSIETLRADLARVTVEMNDLRAQWDMYGGDVGITETFKELERLKKCIEIVEKQRDAAVKKYEAEKEDFLDYALSGTQNAAPFCMNRHPDCVDKRGWCIPVKCHGFSRDKEG